MNVGNVGTQDFAAQAATRRETTPASPPVGANGQGADTQGPNRVANRPKDDVVTLSGNGASKADQAAAPQDSEAQGASGARQSSSALNPNLRADYTVNDGGDLVVRIVDQSNKQVVRQIPDEAQQRIREAITRAAQEQTGSSDQGQAPAKPDVNAAKSAPTAPAPAPVLGAPKDEAQRPPLLGEQSAKATPTPEAQTIGSQTKAAASETQYAAQGRAGDGQESGGVKSGPATPASQEGANNFRDGNTRVETSSAVQEQRESGNTPDGGDSGAESQSEARNGTFREAAIAAAQSVGKGVGQMVNVAG